MHKLLISLFCLFSAVSLQAQIIYGNPKFSSSVAGNSPVDGYILSTSDGENYWIPSGSTYTNDSVFLSALTNIISIVLTNAWSWDRIDGHNIRLFVNTNHAIESVTGLPAELDSKVGTNHAGDVKIIGDVNPTSLTLNSVTRTNWPEPVSSNLSDYNNDVPFVEGTNLSNIIYVDNHRMDTYSEKGTIDWPFKTIQQALDSLVNGDSNRYVIEVAPGVYEEDLYFDNGQYLKIELNAALIRGNVNWNITPVDTVYRAKLILSGRDMRPADNNYLMNGIDGNLYITNNAAISKYPALHLLDCGIKGNIYWEKGTGATPIYSHVFMDNAVYTGDMIVTNMALTINLYAYNSKLSGSASIGGALGNVGPYSLSDVEITRPWVITKGDNQGGDWANVTWKSGSNFRYTNSSYGGTISADANSYASYLQATGTNDSTNATFSLKDKAIGVAVTNTPVNYSTAGSNVQFHLKGIDNALGNKLDNLTYTNQVLTDGSIIVSTFNGVYIAGDGVPVNLTNTTQIANGQENQILMLYGTNDSNTVTLNSTNNVKLSLDISFTFFNYCSMELIFKDGKWVERFRNAH